MEGAVRLVVLAVLSEHVQIVEAEAGEAIQSREFWSFEFGFGKRS